MRPFGSNTIFPESTSWPDARPTGSTVVRQRFRGIGPYRVSTHTLARFRGFRFWGLARSGSSRHLTARLPLTLRSSYLLVLIHGRLQWHVQVFLHTNRRNRKRSQWPAKASLRCEPHYQEKTLHLTCMSPCPSLQEASRRTKG